MTPALRVVLVSLALVLPVAVAAGGGCAALRSPQGPDSPEDDLAHLGRALDSAAPVLLAGRLACQALPPPDREDCDHTLDALDLVTTEGGRVVHTGESCRLAQDAACLQAATVEAQRLLPELLRLLGGGAGSAAPGSPPAPPAASSSPPAAPSSPAAAPAGASLPQAAPGSPSTASGSLAAPGSPPAPPSSAPAAPAAPAPAAAPSRPSGGSGGSR